MLLGAANPDGVDELHVFVERAVPAADETIRERLLGPPQRHVTQFMVHFTVDSLGQRPERSNGTFSEIAYTKPLKRRI